MARVRVPDQNIVLEEKSEITKYLQSVGITYECWEAGEDLSADASQEDILNAYDKEIQRLKAEGGYVTADVISVGPETPNLQTMLDKFNKEHWHDEDEVRFVVEGSGVFYIRPREADVVEVEVQAGDLLSVPKGTWHWFDLCKTRTIKCIRLFQDSSGWAPKYTESKKEVGYVPLCLGPEDIAPRQRIDNPLNFN